MSDLSYIERNRGYLTASKMKTFIKSPEAYYKEFILETPTQDDESKAFLIGTAFDDYFSYWDEFWNEKYFIWESSKKEDLALECIKRWMNITWKEKKEELLYNLYWDMSWKVKLTESEWEKILWMIAEAKRQPLWDLWWKYENQVELLCTYTSKKYPNFKLKMKSTLDRLSIEKKLIRDFKTTSNIKSFAYDLSTKWWYETSMAFYQMMVRIARWVECDSILDVVQSSWTYASESFCYVKDKLNQEIIVTIFPALEKICEMTVEYEKTWDESIWMWTTWDRSQLYELSSYPFLDTALQKEFTLL